MAASHFEKNEYPVGLYCERTGDKEYPDGECDVDFRGVVCAHDGDYVLVLLFDKEDGSTNRIMAVRKPEFYALEAPKYLWTIYPDEASFTSSYEAFLERHEGEEPYEI